MSQVREKALKEPPGLGFGFTVGERHTHTLVYRTQDEARAARKQIVDAYSAAADVIERWAPEKR